MSISTWRSSVGGRSRGQLAPQDCRHPSSHPGAGLGVPPAGIRRRSTWRYFASLLGALALITGCSPDIPTVVHNLPDVVGEWSYSATNITVVGRGGSARCEIEGVTLFIGPWRYSGFYGRSEGGRLNCTGNLRPLDGDLPSYPVRRGGAVAEFIAFDIGTPDWRHEGTLVRDTMSGNFRLRSGGVDLQGQFRVVRRSNEVSVAAFSGTTTGR